MGDKVVLKDDVLRRGHSSLVAAKGDFDQVQDRANDAADAGGYSPLATVLRDSSSDWQLRRGKLSEALESLAAHMKNAIDGFEHWDVVNRDGMKPENPSAPAPDAPAPTVTGQTQQGPSGTTSTGTQAPPPVQGTGGAGGAGGTAGPLPSVPPAVPGFTDHSGVPPTPPPDLTGVPVPTPEHSEVAPDSSGIIIDSVQLKDANLEQLLHALTDRWTKLGGDEQAVLAALAGIGVAGGVASFARAGGSSAKPAGSAVGTSTPPTGEQASVAGLAGGNSPAGPTGGTQADAAAQGQPVGIAPEPGIAGTEGSETAPEDSRAGALVEAPSALTHPGSAASADPPPAADTSGSSLGQPSAPGASYVPEAPPALTGLTTDAADGAGAAGAAGADPGSASAPEALPPLGGGSSTAPIDLPPASSSLPSLASAPVGQAEATMAAAAVPVGASMLHQGGQGAAPVSGAAGAALPSLSGSSGGAAASGGEVRRGTQESAVRDARRILADLSSESGEEKH